MYRIMNESQNVSEDIYSIGINEDLLKSDPDILEDR